jgi:hypothetical protein
MRDVVERIRKCFGDIPRELGYEAVNEIELLHAELIATKVKLADTESALAIAEGELDDDAEYDEPTQGEGER